MGYLVCVCVRAFRFSQSIVVALCYCLSSLRFQNCTLRLQCTGAGRCALVETHADVTPNAGSQVDLGLEVELDADQEGGGLLVAVVVGGTPEERA